MFPHTYKNSCKSALYLSRARKKYLLANKNYMEHFILAKSIGGETPWSKRGAGASFRVPPPPFACRPAWKPGRGGAGLHAAPTSHKQGHAQRARGGVPLPIPVRPLLPFSQPPPSRVPPQFVRDWGHKKGGRAPPPIRT